MPMPRSLVVLLILAIPPGAPAQEPALPKGESPARSAGDLSNRYHFVERYTTRDDPARPWLVGPYQVAIRETTTTAATSDGQPVEPISSVRTSVFNERPAEVSSLGAVSATVRTYTRHEAKPDDPAGLDGLSVWYRPVSNEFPQILGLTAGRSLREGEYLVAVRQVFLPGLAAILPGTPIHVDDSWRPPRRAIQALLGEPEARSDGVTARFTELTRDPDGKTSRAAIAVRGRVNTPAGEVALNAEIIFAFATPGTTPDPVAAPAPGRTAPVGLIEARGAITGVRLARVTSEPASGPTDKAPRSKARVELILERKLGGPAAEPIQAPAVTEANSWLTAVDPAKRLTFRHPQDLFPPDSGRLTTPKGPAPILLTRTGREGHDLVKIEVSDGSMTPETFKQTLKTQWTRSRLEVLTGDEGWLPESEWPEMKVYRIEAALRLAGRNPRGSRIHYDAYFVRPKTGASLTVVATTTGDAIPPFRRDVEAMIRTIRIGPGKDE